MKKLFTTCTLAVAALFLGACSGSPGPRFTATSMGVGPVLLCLDSDRIPAAHDGLYDAFTVEPISGSDYARMKFSLAGEAVMDALLYDNKIESITAFSAEIGSPDGIRPGSGIESLFKKGGVPEAETDNQFMIRLNGLSYRVSGLRRSALIKIRDAYNFGVVPHLTVDDFMDDAAVESILID